MLTMPACAHHAGVHMLQSLASYTVNRIGRTHINIFTDHWQVDYGIYYVDWKWNDNTLIVSTHQVKVFTQCHIDE